MMAIYWVILHDLRNIIFDTVDHGHTIYRHVQFDYRGKTHYGQAVALTSTDGDLLARTIRDMVIKEGYYS